MTLYVKLPKLRFRCTVCRRVFKTPAKVVHLCSNPCRKRFMTARAKYLKRVRKHGDAARPCQYVKLPWKERLA